MAKLNGISVHSYHFASPGLYDPAAIDLIRRQYEAAGWRHLVAAHAKGDPFNSGQTDLWINFAHMDVRGMVVLSRPQGSQPDRPQWRHQPTRFAPPPRAFRYSALFRRPLRSQARFAGAPAVCVAPRSRLPEQARTSPGILRPASVLGSVRRKSKPLPRPQLRQRISEFLSGLQGTLS